MPPITQPIIAPVFFAEEPLLLVLSLLLLASFVGVSVEAVAGPDVLRGDASVNWGDDGSTFVSVCFVIVVVVVVVIEDDCVVVELKRWV